MKRHRFILPYAAFRASTAEIADAALTHQLRTVLRIKPGEEVLLCDGDSTEVLATVQGYDKDTTSFALGTPYAVQTEPAVSLTIYAAITKRDTFEWAVQKAVECGVACIVPVITERTIKQNLNLERLRSIAKEAAEQSGRGIIPAVEEPVSLRLALEHASDTRYIASTKAGVSIKQLQGEPGTQIAVLIGPEGGFTENEEQDALERGWAALSLGTRILRAETAVVVVVAGLL